MESQYLSPKKSQPLIFPRGFCRNCRSIQTAKHFQMPTVCKYFIMSGVIRYFAKDFFSTWMPSHVRTDSMCRESAVFFVLFISFCFKLKFYMILFFKKILQRILEKCMNETFLDFSFKFVSKPA